MGMLYDFRILALSFVVCFPPNVNASHMRITMQYPPKLHTRVRDHPSEARTWVISSGTENTIFSWSVWRRLPLHEVRK